jgi:Apg6 coiled-coil region
VILQDSVIHNIPSNVSSPSQTRKLSAVESGAATPRKELPADDVDHVNPSPLSHHLRSTQRLLNLISSRTDVDHPLCAECTHILLTSLTRQLEETKKEYEGYVAFEREVKKEKEREKEGLNPQEAQRKIARLKEDERLAIEQVLEAEREREQLAEELRSLELEEKALEEEEEECGSYSPLGLALKMFTFTQVLAFLQRTLTKVSWTELPVGVAPCNVCRRFGHSRTARTHKRVQRRFLHRTRRRLWNYK